jgi:exopolysaccharide biosynthesis protein
MHILLGRRRALEATTHPVISGERGGLKTTALRSARRVRALPLLLLAAACTSTESDRSTASLNWEPVDSLNAALPAGVRVFAGVDERLPLRAWYVRIDEPDPSLVTRVAVSDDEADKRETVSSFAAGPGVCVAVNGGYFTMDQTPARHRGLLLADGVLQEPPTPSIIWDSLRYQTARAAVGFTGDDVVEIAWVASRLDTLFAWSDPPPHRTGQPAGPLRRDQARVWEVHDALAAGPRLVVGGEVRVTLDEEGFFGSYLRQPHPRTAAGRTADGALILMVVDGRQTASRGVTLDELARLMVEAGAVDALNLDGGGSSTLVVNGTLVNRPTGGSTEREVMSALVTFCE